MSVWKDWADRVGARPPLAHVLREELSERWVRIHNLPEGKRLPADSAEEETVLYRNNVVASAVLGIGSPCIAFAALYPEDERWIGRGWSKSPAPPRWDVEEELREELEEATFLCRQMTWRPAVLDQEICRVARGVLAPLTVLSLATSGVYRPYDGGIDLFFRRQQDAASTKLLFQRWTSDLPSGL